MFGDVVKKIKQTDYEDEKKRMIRHLSCMFSVEVDRILFKEREKALSPEKLGFIKGLEFAKALSEMIFFNWDQENHYYNNGKEAQAEEIKSNF